MTPARAGSLATALIVAAIGVVALTPASPTAAATRRPNIVLILTDDMAMGDLPYVPTVRRLIGDQGVTFDESFVNNPACCPSRVTMLTGRYAHNTGVFSNGGINGGFETAHAKGLERDTVATRLQHVGYRTGLFGKYLNGYPNGVDPEWVPPGWTRWVSPAAGDPYEEYNYSLNVDGHLENHGIAPADYGTTVYTHAARRFMKRTAASGKPFFVALTVYAPHLPATAAPQDLHDFPGVRAPRTPSFNQRDVSKSPSFVRELPRFDQHTTNTIDELFRDRIRSLQAVDRAVGTIIDTVSKAGQLDNTYFVFTSDNGFHLGQHRLPAGKYTAYDTDIHVPLMVRGPGVPAGDHVHALTGNIDLAPTFAAIAGAKAPSARDGRSLLGLAQDPDSASSWSRNAFLVEHRRDVGKVKRSGDLPLEPSDPEADAKIAAMAAPSEVTHRSADSKVLRRSHGVPDYDAVRTTRWLYVEYADGQKELYDLRADPDEQENLAGAGHVSVEATLHRRLVALQQCAGASCRRSGSGSAARQVSVAAGSRCERGDLNSHVLADTRT